jgi:hypothetical protein
VSQVSLSYHRQCPQIRRITWTAKSLAHRPSRPTPADVADTYGARDVIGIQRVEGTHQPSLAGTVPCVEEVRLDLCDRGQVQQHHAACLVVKAGPVERLEEARGGLDQVGRKIGGVGGLTVALLA